MREDKGRASDIPPYPAPCSPLAAPWIDVPTWSRYDGVAVVLLTAAVLLLLAPIAFQGELPLDADTLLFFYPLRALHGDPNVGLWNPYLLSGMPRDANPQAQILYPPNLIALLLPPSRAFAALLIGHYLLGGLLMYGLLRALRLSPSAAFTGAAVFVLGTFWRCKIANLGLLEGIAWLPGVVLFQWLAIARKSLVPLLASGLLLAMTVLAGVPHTVLYALMLLVVGALGFWRWEGRGVFFILCAMMAPPLIAALLSAGMILPAVLYAPESVRGPLSLEDALAGAIPFGDLWKVFLGGMSQPEITRADPWEGTVYYGATALLLAALGWNYMHRRLRWALAVMFAFGVLLAMGGHGGIYWALYHLLPGWNTINLPNRALLAPALVIPIFAGFGAQRFLDSIPLNCAKIVVIALAAVALLGICISAMYTGLMPYDSLIYAADTQSFDPDAPPDGLWAIFNACFWLSLSLGLAALRQIRYVKPVLALFALVILIVAQSIQYTPRLFLQTTPVTSEQGYFTTAGWSAEATLASLRPLLDSDPHARVMGYVPAIDVGSDVRSRYTAAVMMHRLAEVYGVREIQGYDPLMPRRYVELLRAWAGQSPSADGMRILRLDTSPKPLLDLLGVRWIIGYPNQEILYRGRQLIDQPSMMASMLEEPAEIRSLSFRWMLLGAGGIPNMARVGEVSLIVDDEDVRAFPIQAGVSIANQFSEFAGSYAAHRPAPVYRWIPIPSPGGYERAQQYTAEFTLEEPILIDGVGIRLDAPGVALALLEIAYRRSNPAPYRKAAQSELLPIFENPHPHGFVYFSREVKAYQHVEEMIGVVGAMSSDQPMPVFFHSEDGPAPERAPITGMPLGDVVLQAQRNHSDRFSIEIRTPHDGWLAIAENYSPYWTAWRFSGDEDDDEEVIAHPADIQRANHAFMAVQIPAGAHRLEFHYRPKPFYYGTSAAGVALLFIVLLLACFRTRWLQPSRTSEQDNPARQ